MKFKHLIALTKKFKLLQTQCLSASLTEHEKQTLLIQIADVKEQLALQCVDAFERANSGDDIHVLSGKKSMDNDDTVLVCFAPDKEHAQDQFITQALGIASDHIAGNASLGAGEYVTGNYTDDDGETDSFFVATNRTLDEFSCVHTVQ